MRRVKVVDSTFSHANAIGYGGERRGEYPLHFQWDSSPGFAETKVWTDIRLREAEGDPAGTKIALLLEPPAINSGMYEWVRSQKIFDVVLTHQRSLVEQGQPFLFYPFGGSWIREWGLFPKRKMVSVLVSGKDITEGQRLRMEAAKLPDVDSYGNGVGRYVDSKAEALRDYRFAIVIENDRTDYWFTEKLIDAISQGCVVLYRGCPSIGDFFDRGSIIPWIDLDELEAIVKSLTPEDYTSRLPAASLNIVRARQYQTPENWIAREYGKYLRL